MQYRQLGSTGIRVSAVSFGAGPVPALLTSGAGAHEAVVARALQAGINWFDTAATYGDGSSERHLGAALARLGALEKVHIATKVRLFSEQMADICGAVRTSLEGSLSRLGASRVTLLQLHNSITLRRGDEPTSLSPRDVLGPGGVFEAMQQLQSEGLIEHVGLTGIGQPAALLEVIRSGRFATVQTPYNLVNPTAGRAAPAGFGESDYGNLIEQCARQNMGVFAIRVFAGGALASQPPSAHTHTTKFFPLDLYQRDLRRAAQMRAALAADGIDLREAALRFVLCHPHVSSAIVGFGAVEHVDEAVQFSTAGALANETIDRLLAATADGRRGTS